MMGSRQIKTAVESVKKAWNVSLVGLSESQKCHVISVLKSQVNKPMVIITYNDVQAKKIYEDLSFFLGNDVLLFPHRQLLFYNITAHSNDISEQRISVLGSLCLGQVKVIVAPVEALLTVTVSPRQFSEGIKRITDGDKLDMDGFVQGLVRGGYERVDMIEGKGQFSVRGGIIDVFGAGMENPIRMELFDDEVDSIREFDVNSQRSIQRLKSFVLFPAREVTISDDVFQKAKRQIEGPIMEYIKSVNGQGTYNTDGLLEKLQPVLDARQNIFYFEGVEELLPVFYHERHTFFDYLGDDGVIFIDEPERVRQRAENVHLEFDENFKTLLIQGEVLKQQYNLMMNYRDLVESISQNPCVKVVLNTLPRTSKDFRVNRQVSFVTRTMHSFHGQVELLAEDLKMWKAKKYRVLLLTGTKARGLNLVKSLQDVDVECLFTEDDEMDILPGQIVAYPGSISKGFEYPDYGFAVISDNEIFAIKKRRTRIKKQRSVDKIDVFTDLKPGDYVVHEYHGIGLLSGLVKLEVEGQVRDYLHIKYSGGDSLYVPADQMDYIQKYIGIEGKAPRLSKMGGGEWNRLKSRVKQSIREMAEDLLKLYATRQTVKGHRFKKDTIWQRQFEELFPYEETPDQLQAIEEVKLDMETDKPMDRLLCGDVGYGKTEVAIRAAFKAVMDGKQVAFLVPTTILAQQHYNTLTNRLNDFPVKVEVLSRFKTPKEQKTILRNLENGLIDIIIGTHRLLQADVGFKDLGLLIVDEEQRFGVAHKERIKNLRTNVDVLTLTATPIPRTLHMSMVGIRDMSILETPPDERYPVQTYVVEYNEGLIRDAILREMGRDGQVYFVYNRVQSIEKFAAKVARLVPEARVAVAHGQMNETMLEDVMIDFMEHRYDVLVCSTIIESGLDIPNVNTIIVYDSDRFGLAQLYQLRGRVGRSNRLAYAYLTYRKDKILSEVAEKRLHAIKEFTEFGSGFKIAMKDLEIRGAGNLLGPEQHGHMATVGYDLYCKLLEQTIGELKGDMPQEQRECTVNIDISAYIPRDYIEDDGQRLEMYKKIASINALQDKYDVEEELEDRFGDIPVFASNLINISYLKALARQARIVEIIQKNGIYQLKLGHNDEIKPLWISKIMEKYGNRVTFSATKPPFFIFKPDTKETTASLGELQQFLKEIADLHGH
ncbi:MAG TPA: transcription-repair coupling factor [Clostridiales bacterium]|nr:transcription-repair coupling factor [Clostridiales bacterium]